MRLRAQQTAFADAVTGAHPADGALVTPGPRLGAAERVEIYRDGYRARLVECLADDYAAVRSAIGADAFEAAARGYIDAYPSRSPSLNAFGRAMPDFLEEFLARDPGAVPARFAVDLARLEWAIVETIHAAPSPALTLERLQHLAPEQWATAALVPAAAARVLRFAYPVSGYFTAFRRDEGPAVPRAAASAILIHRPGWIVTRTELTPPMAALLEALFSGTPLGEALERAISAGDAGAMGAMVTAWFRDWVESGVFTAIAPPA